MLGKNLKTLRKKNNLIQEDLGVGSRREKEAMNNG